MDLFDEEKPENPRIVLGANNPPPDDEVDHGLSIALARLADYSLECVCRFMRKQDPGVVVLKRQGGQKLITRQVWFYAMRNHIPQVVFAKITGLYRGTIGDDQETIRRWCERNGLISETMDALEDHLEPLNTLIANMEEFSDDCMAEKAADLACIKARALVKEAADLLDRPAPTPASMRRAEAEALVRKGMEREAATYQTTLNRIDARIAEEAAKKQKKTRATA